MKFKNSKSQIRFRTKTIHHVRILIVKIKVIIIKESKQMCFTARDCFYICMPINGLCYMSGQLLFAFLFAYKNNKVTITCNHSL